ncbi:MAG: hypothetical protein Q9208_006556 [Pyrenodesmia sp. 3 TL-2023]
MASTTSKTVSALARHRSAILAVTAIAAGLIIYSISNSLYASQIPSTGPSKSLHRSNAQRRRRRHPTPSAAVGGAPASSSHREGYRGGTGISYGQYHRDQGIIEGHRSHNHVSRLEVSLIPNQLPSVSHIHTEWGVDMAEAALIRQVIERTLLDNFFAQEMPPGPPVRLTQAAREGFVRTFAAAGQISAINTEASIDRYERGDLDNHRDRPYSIDRIEEPRPIQLWLPDADTLPPGTPGDLSSTFQVLRRMTEDASQDDETTAETESNQSDEAGGYEENLDNKPSQDQNLMNLLYRIAEDQAKKEGFVHRGVNCNSCNAMPIRGIRYRCTNCNDYDLCEQCEALQVHDKTHLFYKIRIPAPFLGNPRQPQPVWYPGKPERAARSLTTELKTTFSTTTGIQDRQVEAYWEQFQCLAGSTYLDDPYGFQIAIGRKSFDQCFVPNVTPRPPPPNLVYDRMFAFYDTNGDGLIGFEEFLSGIACVAQGGKEMRARIFQAYDVDNDGFIDRKDFLRMFRAHYALVKDLTKQVVSGMDDEFFDEEDVRQLIAGSQPISSIFSGPIPSGEPSQPSDPGKTQNLHGDLVINDDQGIKRDNVSDSVYAENSGDNLVADNAELRQFGTREPIWFPELPRLTSEVGDDKWPPAWLTAEDVEDALGRVAEPDTIEDPAERSMVLCASQERGEQEQWVRVAFRRRLLSKHWEANQFYLDNVSMSQPPWMAGEIAVDEVQKSILENEVCSLRIKALERNEEPQFLEGYHLGIKREVAKKWPDYPELDGLPERFSGWIRHRYKWHKLAQALAPTRHDIPEASCVVGSLLHDFFSLRGFVVPRRSADAPKDASECSTLYALQRLTREARGENPDDDGADDDNDSDDSQPSSPSHASDAVSSPSLGSNPKLKASSSREKSGGSSDGSDSEGRSSSTSVASETDAADASKRYCVDGTPEPRVDVGREVIYQVTQESMNELLDPIFRLREDLAVAITKTQRERELRKDAIRACSSADFLTKAMLIFQDYQKRWYQKAREEDDPIVSESTSLLYIMCKCFLKWGIDRNGRMNPPGLAKQTDGANLQEATDAMINLDQSVANEVQRESPSANAEPEQETAGAPAGGGPIDGPPEHPVIAAELHKSMTALDKVDLTAKESSNEKPLELLLADAGYGIVTPPVGNLEESTTSILSATSDPSAQDAEGARQDPTLPQNRPNTIAEWEAQYESSPQVTDKEDAASELSSLRSESPGPQPESLPPLTTERLVELSLLTMIEEDDKSRGGPGRLSFHDYELIMEGDKGEGLGFVGSWVEAAAF